MKFNLSDFLQLDTKELLAVNGGFNCNGSSNTTVYQNTYYPSTPGGAVSNLPSSSRAVVGSSVRLDGTIRYDYDDGSHLFIYPDGQRQFYPGSDGKSKENNGKDASSSSGGGSCSTSSSNNPNGQGPSTTEIHSGGGTCPGKDGGTYIPSGSSTGDSGIPNGGGICSGTGGSGEGEKPDTDGGEITNPDDVTSGGGTCSSKNDTDKVSGMFGQITDGSYADKLTMQYYKNKPGYMFHPEVNDEAMYGTYTVGEETHDCIFSKVGCIETASAKIASELTGDEIPLISINNNFDANKDGDLSLEDIAIGIDKLLDQKYGDIYDVIGKNINNPSLGDLNEVATPAEGDICFVLGKAPDCHGGHWVVLEGYSTNSNGVVTFSYDGTSDNDVGRSFVLGKNNQDVNNNVYGITRIETFTIHKK